MKIKELTSGTQKNILIGALMLISLFILLPSFIRVVGMLMAPYTDDEVVITTVSYQSEVDGEDNLVVGNLYQPAPKFTDKEYPAIIACHGFLMGIGKESMHRWCVELAKRNFVVLAIDVPGNGMSIGGMDMVPRADYESVIIKDGIKFLKSYDFVDGSKIGLTGISYGAGIVSMCAGELGNLVEATVAMNGFTNLTNWLVEGILPDADFKFTVKQDSITLEKVEDTKITKDNIKDILKVYRIYTGSDEALEDLIIPNTNRLDRKFLKKFDAVEYFPNARNGSVMFIHSKHDNTFSKTNQSGQGYTAIINANKTATYILVDDNHQLMDDPDYVSDYCLINFFEEKLKDVDLGEVGVDWEDDYEKYSQKRNIKLTASKEFGFLTFYECLISFALSLIPAFLVISIIFYNKKFETKRAIKEEEVIATKEKDDKFVDFTFGRGSYIKTIIFLALLYIIAYTAIMGIGLGFFSEIIAGFFCGAFYLVFFLVLYYLPDQAEVDLWKRLKRKNSFSKLKSKDSETKLFDVNSLFILLSVLAIVIIGAVFVSSSITMPPFFMGPIEQVLRSMMIYGAIMLGSGILLIVYLEKKQNEGLSLISLDWDRYTLDKYQILKSLTFGSVLFLNFIFQWTIWAFYMKFPMILGPHSWYYLFMVLAVILFFSGMQLMIKILKEKFLKDNIEFSEPENRRKEGINKIFIEFFSILIGVVLYGLAIYIIFYPLLNMSIFGNLTWQAVQIFVIILIITSIIKIFCVDRGIFGVTAFFPLLLFAIVGFFLHI